MATYSLLWLPGHPTKRYSCETALDYPWRGSFTVTIVICVLLSSGCGGGASPSSAQVSVTPADFSIQLSPGSLTLSQGMTASSTTLSVTPQNGFSGTVQVTLSGLPAGMASNPASPFAIAAGSNVSLIFGASANAATGNFLVTATGSSGSLSHTATLALTITSGVAAPLPHSSYARTDAQPALDDPPREPARHHIAYDPAHKHIFVANRAMNRVEAFSSADQSRIAEISVPGAASADLSADGATVWIGTATEQAIAWTRPPCKSAHATPFPLFRPKRTMFSIARKNCWPWPTANSWCACVSQRTRSRFSPFGIRSQTAL